ncbi:hypothetical protein J2787_003312 [Chryseobacterium rhizosphaerae]|uniref:DUF4876 domain-containing protein n=1 Tax=Chryseobacterium rhizosphaerae TaxID=395937 RepID=A0AAE3YAI0_9FLAO|nr:MULTISPECIES: DUF4876 domain-containing protein [Chryseobacterium]MDR6527920.1 hypothetical protein [Chryseobacterium rhizosphaerae]
MKNIITYLFLPLLILTGCKREDDFGSGSDLQPVPFTIAAKYDAKLSGKEAVNANIILENTSTGDKIIGKTDVNGELKFNAILPGTYTITADMTMSKEDYEDTFEIPTINPEVYFGGMQEKVIVNVNVSAAVITLSSGRIEDLVIKQVYYAGSSTTEAASFRDHFLEIYNNSNEMIYADGLYVGLLEGNTNSNVTSYTLPNGQYDWSKSTGNTIGGSANTDFVYASTIIRVPGSGKEHPILPGKSIVIAQTALNHKAPYDDIKGQSVSIKKPEETIDLSGADFETYLGDYFTANGGTPYLYDIQNIMVPDMEIVHWALNSKDMLLGVTSRPAFIVFKATPGEISSFTKVPSPKNLNGALFVRIPKEIIIDGVDTTDKEQKAPKDLPVSIDATRAFIKNDAGSPYPDYSSYSIIRKTKEIIKGRVVLMDTNNSQNDFTTIKANPRGNAQ